MDATLVTIPVREPGRKSSGGYYAGSPVVLIVDIKTSLYKQRYYSELLARGKERRP
jgi:hypothetical protein